MLLIEHPALYKTLSENGRSEVQNITWENVGYKVRGIYDELNYAASESRRQACLDYAERSK